MFLEIADMPNLEAMNKGNYKQSLGQEYLPLLFHCSLPKGTGLGVPTVGLRSDENI